MKTTGIYAIRHIESGKMYIGSSQHIEGRWRSHRFQLRREIHSSIMLQRAWAKYGEAAFAFEVLEICSVADLLEREQDWIDQRKTVAPNGYNTCAVAGTRRGVPQPESVGEKLRAVHLGRPKSPETRAKIAAAHLGKKKHTEESKAKLRASAMAQMAHPERREISRQAAISQNAAPEARAAMSARAKGQMADPAARENLSRKVKERLATPEGQATVDRVAAANRGREFSDETRANMSKAGAARWTEAERQAQSERLKARYAADPSLVEKQRAILERAGRAAVIACRGKKLSDETRRKMSEAHLARSAARKSTT